MITPSPRFVAMAALVVLAIGMQFLLVRPGPTQGTPSTAAIRLAVPMPVEVVAGTTVTVELEGVTGTADLLVVGSAGPVIVPVVAGTDGRAIMELPAVVTTVRGLVTIDVDGRRLAVVVVLPDAPQPEVRSWIGPRTIVTGSGDHTMATVVPTDRHGNPVADGTPVGLDVRRPDGASFNGDAAVVGLLAWERIPAGTVAGRTSIRVDVTGAAGPVGEVVEVAGPPLSVAVEHRVAPALADGRSLVPVQTGLLVDLHGNQVADGVEVVFRTDGPDGRGHLTAVVTAGRSSVDVPAPPVPGTVLVRATVNGVSSPELALTFAPAVDVLPVTAALVQGRLQVAVGPVLDPLGAWLPDGTLVTALLGEHVAEARLIDGRALLDLPDLDCPLRVTVAGTTQQVQ